MYKRKEQLIYEITNQTTINQILDTLDLGKKTKYELYQSDRIQVNGMIKRQSCELHSGDELSIDTKVIHTRIKSSPFEVLYEDDILLIIYKPKGYLVHSDGSENANVQDELRKCYKGNVASELQAIHRIDIDTSGLLIFSKTSFFQPKLDAMVADNTIKRTYLAVVEGNCPTQTIESAIARDRHNAKLMRISASGKDALTHVTQHKFIKDMSLVSCTLETGRTHQIRVHLASIKHPVVGDELYNKKKSSHALCLHSYRALIPHPLSSEVLDVKVFPHPQDFPSLFHESHVKLKK